MSITTMKESMYQSVKSQCPECGKLMAYQPLDNTVKCNWCLYWYPAGDDE